MSVEIRYGVRFALLVVVYVLIEHALGLNTLRHDIGQYTRLAGVLVPIAGVVFGIRARKAAAVDGRLSFGEGLKSGTVIAVVQTTLTTAWFWLYGTVVNPEFLPTMLEFERARLLAGGADTVVAAARVDGLRVLFSFPNLQIFQEAFGIAYGAVTAAIAAAWLRGPAGAAGGVPRAGRARSHPGPVCLAAAVAAVGTVAAQAVPALSGSWQPDEARNQAARANVPAEAQAAVSARAGLAGPVTVVLTARQMTVSRTLPDGTPLVTVYALDGTASRNRIPGRGEVESIARIEGNAVVIRSETDGTVQRWFLDGKALVYERSAGGFLVRTHYIAGPS